MCECFPCMYVCTPHTCLVFAEKMALGLLEVELQIAVNHYVGAGY